jgi:hypothetical protein
MPGYRVKIDMVYSANNQANNAVSGINGILDGYPTIAERASRNGTTVNLEVNSLDEATATSLNTDLIAGWTAGTRTGGKVSMVLTP